MARRATQVVPVVVTFVVVATILVSLRVCVVADRKHPPLIFVAPWLAFEDQSPASSSNVAKRDVNSTEEGNRELSVPAAAPFSRSNLSRNCAEPSSIVVTETTFDQRRLSGSKGGFGDRLRAQQLEVIFVVLGSFRLSVLGWLTFFEMCLVYTT
jgi:hypothetical protein